ncbi:uncharacterized protein LOC110987971 [Acanthaster planci]|uniref:Uncharacterized protein LOC110987971 n=1 Tax=Acanthaster planci TaxID=133434 RepID=A0A8B7ZPM3_ACAPL|nr:uncharacterized protein LOC110987971 [Acanthaster planci]
MTFAQDYWLVLVAVFVFYQGIITPCLARPDGAPSEACSTLLPRHGSATPRQPPNPYRIQLGAIRYVAGGTVRVTLTGPNDGMKGFILQARRVGQSTPVGTWENLPPNTRTMACLRSGDTVTHSTNQPDTAASFTWRAPTTNVGTLEFVATVVQSFSTFWGPFRSSEVTATGGCSPNPCLNGQCVTVGSSFQCNCQAGFTGTTCQVRSPCLSNPCFNGGACSSLGSGYQCNCLTGFTGTQCEIQVGNACSSSPCLNGGVCTSFGSAFQCSCQPGFTGAQCQTTTTTGNSCSPNPCRNSATCTVTGSNTFTCTCRTGTSGPLCATINDACFSSPCQNGGQCTTTGSSYLCNCPSGYTGPRCSTQITACSSNPCLNDGQCSLVAGTSNFQCSCTIGYFGSRCQSKFVQSCLLVQSMSNGGQCSMITGTSNYQCNCLTGYSGARCQTSACTSNPCLNEGQCSLIGTSGYQCACQSGFSGTTCQIHACSSNPCLNDGQCSLVTGTTNYQCSCLIGYSGARCQTTACSSSPCLNNGQCSVITGTANYQCSCSVEYSGLRCQITACSSNPCLNGGQCSLVMGTSNFRCSCSSGYSGTRCEIDSTSCFPNPCFNGGQCMPITGGAGYRCICPSDFTGLNCLQSLDPCVPNPCLNGGTCSSLTSSSFQCRCADGWSGVVCATRSADVCAEVNICQNGGTCEPNTGGSFSCRCAEGFDGVDCSNMISPCFPNPCLNGATCVVSGPSSFTCTCPLTHSGIICSVRDMCTPSPCNSGVCQQVAGDPNYTCTCNAGYSGSHCDIQALCNPNPCVNGICSQNDETLTYSCQCDVGFMGENCDQQREAPCESSPCRNGGICQPKPDGLTFDCFCLSGYQGTLCGEAVIPIFQNCPENQILTFPLDPGQSSANIMLSLEATVPGVPAAPTVEVVTGPSIPGTVPYTEEYRVGKVVVMRAQSATEATAECTFVLRMIDEEPPVVVCPEDITKFTYGSSEAVEWPPATAVDNLAQSSDMTISYSMDSGSFFLSSEEESPNTIEVTAVDTFDNVARCQFDVTVVKIPNAPPPVFTGCREGETLSYQVRNNTDVAYVSLNLQAKDSSQQPAIVSQLEGPSVDLPGDIRYTEGYRQGQRFVFTALDPVTQLTANCTFWIKIVDKQPPTVRCPSNVIERTTANTKAIFWPPVDVEDNLPLPDENTVAYDQKNGTVFDATRNGLSQIVTVTAIDSFGNSGSCQFSVTLYKFDVVCPEFPVMTNGAGDCAIAPDGKMECRIVCDSGYEYAPTDNRFKCEITSTKAFWQPTPNPNACMRPTAGTAISKTVTAVFPFDANVCDVTNLVFVSNIQTSIQSSLREADLCQKGVAQACTPDSVQPKCGVVASGGAARKRKRQAFTDLSVDIVVTAPAADTQGSSLSDVQQDVDDLATSIKELADGERLSLVIDHQMVYSLSSGVSNDYVWICAEGYKSTTGGCVLCPAGTYFNTTSLECLHCEQGYFQFESGQTACIQCATGRSTDQRGSISRQQCVSVGETAAFTWSPFLASMVGIAVAFLVVLFIGLLCICVCVPSTRDRRYARNRDLDGSLSNLKYLNKAYEEEYTKRRAVGMHRLTTKRQKSPSRASTATGYITMSSNSGSRRNQADMVSIDSDDYRRDISDGEGRQAHFNRGHTIERDSGMSYGHASTATMGSGGGGFHSPSKMSASNTQTRRELPDTGL